MKILDDFLGNETSIEEKLNFLEETKSEKNKITFLICNGCWMESKHVLSIPSEQDAPKEPFDFCHFCSICNAFTSLTNIVLESKDSD